jgi:hypothetical protein
MRNRFLIMSAAALTLVTALPAFARNHGTTPGLEGPAQGKAANPPESRKLSPGQNNPTTAPVAPIGPSRPMPDAPGKAGTAPGQQSGPQKPLSAPGR